MKKAHKYLLFLKSFRKNTKKNEIFEKTAKPIVESVLDGQNGTILAYGQVIKLFSRLFIIYFLDWFW